MPSSIFQQIVLPYLAQSRTIRLIHYPFLSQKILLQTRITHTSATVRRQPESSTSTSSSYSRWEYVPPIDKRSFEKGFDPPGPLNVQHDRNTDEEWEKVRKILDNFQGARRTTIGLALEQLAEIQKNEMESYGISSVKVMEKNKEKLSGKCIKACLELC